MKEELHLFIIWENARGKQKEILEDMENEFEIIKVLEIEWSKDEFANNLSRFYGTKLPKGSGKEQDCGNGKFILVILKIKNPIYEKRMTSKGEKTVNINMFDKKTKYRELTGGGTKIHGTNDEIETNHDLTLLLGKNVEDFLKENEDEKWDGNIQQIATDLFGAREWKTVEEMFYALNNCITYSILRNYEALPNEIYENEHNDIDIICESLEDAAYVLNAIPVFDEEYRVHYKTQVEGRTAYFDLRHIRDNYYCEKMEKEILQQRIYNEKGFYTLNTENYFYSLLYHALIQKPVFKDDYKEKLMNMKLENVDMNTTAEEYAEILKKWLIKKDYIVLEPQDKSVYFNYDNVKYFEPVLYRKEIAIKENEIKELEEQNKNLQQEKENLQNEISNLKTRLESIEDSRTWKIMKPIRDIKRFIKSVR